MCRAVRRQGVLLGSRRLRNACRRGEARRVQRAVLPGEQRRPEQQRVHVRCHLGPLGCGSRRSGSPGVRIARRLVGRPLEALSLTGRFPTCDVLMGGIRARGIRARSIRIRGTRVRTSSIRAGGGRTRGIRAHGTQIAGIRAAVERMPSGFRVTGERLSR